MYYNNATHGFTLNLLSDGSLVRIGGRADSPPITWGNYFPVDLADYIE